MNINKLFESLGIKTTAEQSKNISDAIKSVVESEKRKIREGAEAEIADIKSESEEKITDLETELEEAKRKLTEEDEPVMSEEEEAELKEYVAKRVVKYMTEMRKIAASYDAHLQNQKIMEGITALFANVQGMDIVSETNKKLASKLREQVRAKDISHSRMVASQLKETREAKRQAVRAEKAVRVVGGSLVKEAKRKIAAKALKGLSMTQKSKIRERVEKLGYGSLKEYRRNITALAEKVKLRSGVQSPGAKRTRFVTESTVRPVSTNPTNQFSELFDK